MLVFGGVIVSLFFFVCVLIFVADEAEENLGIMWGLGGHVEDLNKKSLKSWSGRNITSGEKWCFQINKKRAANQVNHGSR